MGRLMRRREFIAALGGAIAATVAKAHPSEPMIGYFSDRSAEAEKEYSAAFRQGLQKAGYVEGRNVRIESRFANGREDRLTAIAAELIDQQAAILVATDPVAALVAKQATASIPIVFSAGSDPVKLGLVESLNRPSGNATGVFVFVVELGPKRLQIIRELVPKTKLIAYVVNLDSQTGPPQLDVMRKAAEGMGQDIIVLRVSTEDEIEKAFNNIVEHKADAIVYSANTFFQVMTDRLVALAAKHSIPAIYEWSDFVHSGGLISYSSDRSEAGRQIGNYAGRILAGAKPADLPVMQSTKFNLAINPNTARTLRLTVPPSLLATADEVIE
jgi:putative tryptophan/tyrosine transport system substrate-binding protein